MTRRYFGSVFCDAHTRTDMELKASYGEAVTATPPAWDRPLATTTWQLRPYY